MPWFLAATLALGACVKGAGGEARQQTCLNFLENRGTVHCGRSSMGAGLGGWWRNVKSWGRTRGVGVFEDHGGLEYLPLVPKAVLLNRSERIGWGGVWQGLRYWAEALIAPLISIR